MAKFNETSQEAFLCDPLQYTTRGHDCLTTTITKWLTSCFALKKHLL